MRLYGSFAIQSNQCSSQELKKCRYQHPFQALHIVAQALDESIDSSDFKETYEGISEEFMTNKVVGIDDPDNQLNDIKGLISQIQHLNNTPHADTLHQELDVKCAQLIRYLNEHPCIKLKTSLSKIFEHVSPRIFSKQINLIRTHLSN